MKYSIRRKSHLAAVILIFILLAGCNLASSPAKTTEIPATLIPSPIASTDTPTTIVHTMIPGEVPGSVSIANDTNTQPNADLHFATAGDLFDLNRFERPFTQNGMVYLPALDIQELRIGKDPNWYYATLLLAGVDTATNSLNADYGLEIDLNKDGRGDILIWVRPPYSTDWSTTPVTVYTDPNGDVGGSNPLKSDASPTGDGYEKVVFNGGQGADPDLAWVRLAPDSPNKIEFAFKPSLLNGTTAFLIGGWADAGLKDPSKFNYNDHFTLSEAGSALHGDANYPIKAVYALDSTCRAAVGFSPDGSEPLVCPLPAVPTPPPACSEIQITAQVTDGTRWDPSWAPGVTLCINGDCKNPDSSGYAVWYLPAGTYTVTASSPSYGIHPSQATTTKACGEKDLIQFIIGPG